jgi:uncharacterized protein YegL
MREVGWSLTALFLLTSACGSTDPVGSDGLPTDMSSNPSTGSGRDGGGVRRDGGRDGSTLVNGGGGPGGKDSGDDQCGRSAFTTGSVIPDMLIVLDRSGSMKPGSGTPANLRCDGTPDFFASLQCALAGIDCNNAQDAMTTYCGGTQTRGPIDRWTPSVNALKTLTKQFEADVAFGLVTFPARSNECGPGDFQVEIDLNTADQIAGVLDRTNPGGGTPTGETLEEARKYFEGKGIAADTVAPAQYVLLVTDGQPTCPNSNGGSNNQQRLNADKQFTIDAIDKLTAAGVKTFVVGYDAQLDQNLATSLREFAQHGGTDDYYPVQNENSLVEAFTKISEVVVTCTFEFKKEISDERLLRVSLDGVTLKPNDPNGWVLEGQKITIQGDSCTKLQNEGERHNVEIALECTPVTYI